MNLDEVFGTHRQDQPGTRANHSGASPFYAYDPGSSADAPAAGRPVTESGSWQRWTLSRIRLAVEQVSDDVYLDLLQHRRIALRGFSLVFGQLVT